LRFLSPIEIVPPSWFEGDGYEALERTFCALNDCVHLNYGSHLFALFVFWFLSGYNFPALPVRARVPRGDGEYIARPRALAILELAPHSIVYHEVAK
jgi:hypothetical protein